ncbi:hypothetical protein ACHAWF_008241 [Thalassiosira exigua]
MGKGNGKGATGDEAGAGVDTSACIWKEKWMIVLSQLFLPTMVMGAGLAIGYVTAFTMARSQAHDAGVASESIAQHEASSKDTCSEYATEISSPSGSTEMPPHVPSKTEALAHHSSPLLTETPSDGSADPDRLRFRPGGLGAEEGVTYAFAPGLARQVNDGDDNDGFPSSELWHVPMREVHWVAGRKHTSSMTPSSRGRRHETSHAPFSTRDS